MNKPWANEAYDLYEKYTDAYVNMENEIRENLIKFVLDPKFLFPMISN